MSINEIEQIIEAINNAESTIFSCHFIKRTTGEARHMVARFDVKKHLKGGKPAYDFLEKGLFPVFDMQKKAYRSIPFEGLRYAKVKGQEFGQKLEV